MKPRIAHISPALGTLPPQAIELEQAVLGACMLESAFGAASFLEPEHFYQEAHTELWKILRDMNQAGERIDILTVTERAMAIGKLDMIGGPFYISQLTNKVASSANVEYHARIIQQKFMLRHLQQMGSKLMGLDETEDVFDTLDMVNTMVAEVNAVPSTKDPANAADILGRIVDSREKPLYIHMGMGLLDNHIRMGPGNVVVIGARPSVGKTTFAVNACMNIARAGHAVLFISLEMNETELTSKIASVLTGVDSERITHGEMNDDERSRVAKAAVENGAWTPRILIEDLSTLKATQVTGVIQRAVTRHDVKVVVIDYLQCMEGEGMAPTERMTHISRACKSAAKSTGVRLVELSQLKRRDGAEEDPEMSDLREAGQIEADGDIIVMLGRPRGAPMLRCKVVKNKVGPIGVVEIPFDLQHQRIGSGFGPSATPSPFDVSGPFRHPDNRIETDNTPPF